MRITSIHFDAATKAETIDTQLTAAEAKFIHTALGNMNGIQMRAVMPNGDPLGTEIYDTLDRIITTIEDDA